MSDKPQLIRGLEALPLIEGDEFVRKYVHTDKLIFAVSWIQPGQRSGVDPGHKGSDEVCYVVSGQVAVAFPDQNLVHELHAGDAVLIPDSVAHETIGLGSGPAQTIWALAPGLGREEVGIGGGK
ncbi:MAG: cupin domain-containing protein [Actinobacteria bacterium]|nr:cupin domain-containing protein [Actinomycetota bacterium]